MSTGVSASTLRAPAPSTPDGHPLDLAAWASLSGPHAHFALGSGLALRYPADVSPFAAVASFGDPRAWSDLSALYGPGESVGLAGPPGFTRAITSPWHVEATIPGVQLVATSAFRSEDDAEAEVIGPTEAVEAVDLVARTEPGPFRARTHELGTYLGLRRSGHLVALAGERLRPPGWTEISAVCTDPDHRRQGLATRLVRAVAHGIRARGDIPFLHTSAANTTAITLYLQLGFELRREVEFAVLRFNSAPTSSKQ